MPQARTVVRPVRIALDDEDLRVRKLRGVGFRAFCSCGWQSSSFRELRDARAQGRDHKLTAHQSHDQTRGGAA